MVVMLERGSVLRRGMWAHPQGHHYDHIVTGDGGYSTFHRGAHRKLGQTEKTAD